MPLNITATKRDILDIAGYRGLPPYIFRDYKKIHSLSGCVNTRGYACRAGSYDYDVIHLFSFTLRKGTVLTLNLDLSPDGDRSKFSVRTVPIGSQ